MERRFARCILGSSSDVDNGRYRKIVRCSGLIVPYKLGSETKHPIWYDCLPADMAVALLMCIVKTPTSETF